MEPAREAQGTKAVFPCSIFVLVVRKPATLYNPIMSSRRQRRGYKPSPLLAEWWGNLANAVYRGQGGKGFMHARAKRTHKTATEKTDFQKCPCEAFKKCDKKYQQLSLQQRAPWRAAVKKPHISGYNLYMKECVSLLIKEENFPDCPSVSGGYSCMFAQGGETSPPAPIIGQAPPPSEFVCCFPDGFCQVLPPTICLARGGEPHYGLTSCDPNPCPQPANDCLDCYPKMPDTMYMTAHEGNAAYFPNDYIYVLTWREECRWRGDMYDVGFADVELGESQWMRIHRFWNCQANYSFDPPDECAPYCAQRVISQNFSGCTPPNTYFLPNCTVLYKNSPTPEQIPSSCAEARDMYPGCWSPP